MLFSRSPVLFYTSMAIILPFVHLIREILSDRISLCVDATLSNRFTFIHGVDDKKIIKLEITFFEESANESLLLMLFLLRYSKCKNCLLPLHSSSGSRGIYCT